MKAHSQAEHRHINATEYPGTRQLCCECNEPTERCEEDEYRLDNGYGPLCYTHYHNIINNKEPKQ